MMASYILTVSLNTVQMVYIVKSILCIDQFLPKSSTSIMATKDREKVFEFVELKNPYKPKTALAAEQLSEHTYQEIGRQTLSRDTGYEDVNKIFGDDVDEVTSEENIKSLQNNSDDGNVIQFLSSKKSFIVAILVIGMATITILLLSLSLAVSNKFMLEDYKRNTSNEFIVVMNHLTKSLSYISGRIEAITVNYSRDIEREKNKINEMNITLTNLYSDVYSKVSQLRGNITTAMNGITLLRSNTTRDINNVNRQLQNYNTTAHSIQTVANRADRRIAYITGSTLLTNCSHYSYQGSMLFTDPYEARNVSVSRTYTWVS